MTYAQLFELQCNQASNLAAATGRRCPACWPLCPRNILKSTASSAWPALNHRVQYILKLQNTKCMICKIGNNHLICTVHFYQLQFKSRLRQFFSMSHICAKLEQNLLNFRHHFLFGISSKISSFQHYFTDKTLNVLFKFVCPLKNVRKNKNFEFSHNLKWYIIRISFE